MHCNLFMDQVSQLLNLELQQIHMAAHLAMFAPNELVRHKVLHMISEELEEAMFLHHVLCAYSDMSMPVSPGMPCPGVGVGPIPGILPPAGPAATLPPSIPISPPGTAPGIYPGIYPGVPYAEKKEEK